MLRAFAPLLFLATAPVITPGPRAEDPDPRALLEAAAEAGRALRSATYKCQVAVTRAGGQASNVTGEVRFTAIDGEDPIGAQLYVRGQVSEFGTTPGTFKLVYDGHGVQGQIGADKVIWNAAFDGAGAELLAVGELLLMEPLHAPERFAADLVGAEVTLGPEVEVGGVACREVVVQHGAAQHDAKVTWALALEDHLPRRRVAEVHRRGVFQTEALEIQELKKNVGIHASVYRIPLPAGFESKAFVSRRASTQLLSVGTLAPDFALRDSSGGEMRLSEHRGEVVVLDFWCTWSPLCRETLPLVQKLHERFAQDERVAVFGLSVEERQESDPEAFLRQAGCTYALLLNGERAAASYAVSGTPTLYVIGTDGRVLYAGTGHDPALDTRVGGLIERHLAGTR